MQYSTVKNEVLEIPNKSVMFVLMGEGGGMRRKTMTCKAVPSGMPVSKVNERH